MLNSTVHSNKNIETYFFLAFKPPYVVLIMLIDVKMPTNVGILTFISRINFVLSSVEYAKCFIALEPGVVLQLSVSITPAHKCHKVRRFRISYVFAGCIHTTYFLTWGRMHYSFTNMLYHLLSNGTIAQVSTQFDIVFMIVN